MKKSFLLVSFSCVFLSSISKDLHSLYRQAREACDVNNDATNENERFFASTSKSFDSISHSHE